jgi:hypothetical protein
MAAEFKIGRLRFNWSGTWTTGTIYARDNVVQYQGKAYVCLVPNTANANFYNDLYATPFPYWQLMVPGHSFSGTWNPSTLYSLDNLVIFDGTVYRCIVSHTSSVFSTDINNGNWTVYVQESTWLGAWQPSTNYGVGAVVTYGGITYKCGVAHTSAANVTLGLEANQSNWSVWYNGVAFLGTWASNYRYKANDLIKVDGDIYICTTYHTSGVSFSSANFTMYLPGESFKSLWAGSTTYQIGDAVIYGGDAYISKTANNLNNIPSSDSTDWGVFNQGFNPRGGWSSANNYKVGDIVYRHGTAYEATQDNINQDPGTAVITTTYNSVGSSGNTIVVASTTALFPGMIVSGAGFTQGQTISSIGLYGVLVLDRGPDSALTNGQSLTFTGSLYPYWQLLVPGEYWMKNWANNFTYQPGDMVSWSNGTYMCVQTHTANTSSNRPDRDTTHIYWVLLIAHDRNNTLSSYGDMETFIAGKYQPIPIGTQSYMLRVTGGYPVWSKINVVPAVYYVDATNGTDRADYGVVWDQPWKSIKYACGIVGQGQYFSNAGALLQANKGWMITEMYQWMLYQCANNIAPFSTTSLFDPFYTQRDASYIVDAVIYDMQRGGNSQTVAATLRFFYYGSQTQIVNSQTEAVITYIAASLNYLLTLMQTVITNTSPVVSYQTLNGISGASYINQIINTNLTAESGTALEISSLMNIVIRATTNQSTAQVPDSNTGTTAIINVKTGTYAEYLPIVIPENVSIVGDELRSTTVQPATSIQLVCTQIVGSQSSNVVVCNANVQICGLADQMPIQFISPYINNVSQTFGGVIAGHTYYVSGPSITQYTFQILDNPTLTITGTLTAGSTIIQNVSNITNLKVGMNVSGPGIPANATILSITQAISSISTVTISAAAITTYILASITVSGNVVQLTDGIGSMTVYAGDCLKDMFYMTNGTTMRNLTMLGLAGQVGPKDQYGIAQPTGGIYTGLNPGKGPDDSTAWIFRRSPYIQNVTNFGTGCTGLKVDGTLHVSGNKSIVCNDYTQILSDGVGVWINGSGALAECVSVFSYYCYIGHYASNGGRIRSTNGNSSYGTFGVVSEGYDSNETPVTGAIFNQSSQVQASVESAFGTSAQLLKLNYSNSGSAYYSPATNLLLNTNNFVASSWVNDGNVTFIKNEVAPTGFTEAFLITGTKATAGTGYVYQNININPSGATYSGISGTTTAGSGSGATFNVIVTSNQYIVTIANAGGSGYVQNVSQITILGSALGGTAPANNLVITVASLTGSAISSITWTGTVPTGSAQSYTLSMYVYPGTSNTIDFQGIFSGSGITLTSGITYNVLTNTCTPYSSGSGTVSGITISAFTPQFYGAQKTLVSGWYRVWFALNDTYGLNNQLQYIFYPQGGGKSGATSNGGANTYTIFYGAQAEVSSGIYSPNFYLENTTSTPTSYSNFEIVGAGSGASFVGDETRSGAVFNARVITDSNGYTGGAGYITSSNNAQSGNAQYIQLAQSEQGVNNYIGMRVFINSGTGAGQYGYISTYTQGTFSGSGPTGASRIAQVLQESFKQIPIVQSSSSGNVLTIQSGTDVSKLYLNQAVQFMPTYYTTIVSQTSTTSVTALSAIGGTTNTITVSSVANLAVNMPIVFGGTTFSTITAGYTYYIIAINPTIGGVPTTNTIQISNALSGSVWQLSTASGSMTMSYPSYLGYLYATSTSTMVVNIPIFFTGSSIGGLTLATTYYISDIIDGNNFTISNQQVSLASTGTTGGTSNTVSVSSVSSLVPLNPVVFGGNVSAVESNITAGQKYYISNIISPTSFQITATIITQTVTATSYATSLITVSDTSQFIQGQPIKFSGLTFGGIVAETVYYIGTIASPTTFTISATVTQGTNVPGSNYPVTDGAGAMTMKTCPTPLLLAGGSGSITVTSTGSKYIVTYGSGTMNATYSTALFGGVSATTIYYILSISGSNITVGTSTLASGGTPISLTNAVGTMQLGAVGWDHINPGTPLVNAMDSTTVYYIEPRTTFSSPGYSQTAILSSNIVTLAPGSSWTSIAYGNNIFLALPSTGITGGISSDGATWQSITLPTSLSWTSIAYGVNYWVAVATGTNIVAYSNSNGLGWRTTTLPSNSTWSQVAYGNGRFVAITSNTINAAVSTNYGSTWTSSTMSGWHTLSTSGNAAISTANAKIGASSLYLDGTSNTYVTSASTSDYSYGTSDFTIEGWVYFSAIGAAQAIFDQRATATDIAILIEINAAGAPRVYINGSYVITHGSTISATTWAHVAVVRASGVMSLYLNGVAAGTTYSDTNFYANKAIVLGSYFSNTARMTGYIDEFRITNKLARYTSGFTPATTAFVADSNTILLLHFEGTNASTTISDSSINGSWVSLTYGSGLFLAITNNGEGSWSYDGINWQSTTLPANTSTLTGVVFTSTPGQISFTTTNTQILVGQTITFSGPMSSLGPMGYSSPTTYYVIATNGSSTATLSTSLGGTAVTTLAGNASAVITTVGISKYSAVKWGNNRFVAVQNGIGLFAAYSFNGITWYQSSTYVSGNQLGYGNGQFFTVNGSTSTGIGYKTDSGYWWKQHAVTNDGYTAIGFGYNPSNIGVYLTFGGTGAAAGSIIQVGVQSQGRPKIASGVITSVSLWEPGSNYTSSPTATFIDYNVSVNASITSRVGNGSLANPTFINRGSGYNTTSTTITITGNGYADQYQTGYTIIINKLSSLPLVGSNLTIAGNSTVYKVTSASAVYGTQAPFIEANVQIAPTMTTALSPANGAAVSIRQLYSQARLTNHDFLSIGVGNAIQSNYPNVNVLNSVPGNQVVEINQGRVFYTSTDQDGNFSVGGLFGVQQATGTVTLSATQFGLIGLSTLSLGGIAVGGSQVVVTQFSTDGTFTANSDAIIPTQRAIKSYLTSRLSQGGSNTFTGNLISGTVEIGNPNIIQSTVPNGVSGSNIKMLQKVNFAVVPGSIAPSVNLNVAVDGDMAALEWFIKSGAKRS